MGSIRIQGTKAGWSLCMRSGLAIVLSCLWISCASAPALAGAWDMDPPPMNDDPGWEKISALWADHYGGRGLDELITILTPIKEKNPDRVEPYLWLARVHYLHARYHRRDRAYHFEKSEAYAAQACRMERNNPLAVKILVEILIYSRDREYIFKNYESTIRSCSPIPTGEALPDMTGFDAWVDFKQLWEARGDIEKAKSAVLMIEKAAEERPSELLVQNWASRANYYVGEYYTCTGELSKAKLFLKRGAFFAERALAIDPNSLPANYWYQINLARSIQFDWLIMKAPYFKTLTNHIVHCSRENTLYYFAGPVLTFSTMITHGGWVTEKGMELLDITPEMAATGLELVEILTPDYYYIPFAKADLLAYKKKKQEALAVLEQLLTRDPDVDKQVPENRMFLIFAKKLYTDIKKGRR